MSVQKDKHKEDREFARKWLIKKHREMKKKSKNKVKTSREEKMTDRKNSGRKSTGEEIEKYDIPKESSKPILDNESKISNYMRDYNEEKDGWIEAKKVKDKKTNQKSTLEKEWKSFKVRLLILFLSGLVATGVYTGKEVKKFMDTIEEVRIEKKEKIEEPNLNLAKAYSSQWKDQEYLARISGVKENDTEEEKEKKMQETYNSLSDEFKFFIRNPEKVKEIEEKESSNNNVKKNEHNYGDTERD